MSNTSVSCSDEVVTNGVVRAPAAGTTAATPRRMSQSDVSRNDEVRSAAAPAMKMMSPVRSTPSPPLPSPTRPVDIVAMPKRRSPTLLASDSRADATSGHHRPYYELQMASDSNPPSKEKGAEMHATCTSSLVCTWKSEDVVGFSAAPSPLTPRAGSVYGAVKPRRVLAPSPRLPLGTASASHPLWTLPQSLLALSDWGDASAPQLGTISTGVQRYASLSSTRDAAVEASRESLESAAMVGGGDHDGEGVDEPVNTGLSADAPLCDLPATDGDVALAMSSPLVRPPTPCSLGPPPPPEQTLHSADGTPNHHDDHHQTEQLLQNRREEQQHLNDGLIDVPSAVPAGDVVMTHEQLLPLPTISLSPARVANDGHRCELDGQPTSLELFEAPSTPRPLDSLPTSTNDGATLRASPCTPPSLKRRPLPSPTRGDHDTSACQEVERVSHRMALSTKHLSLGPSGVFCYLCGMSSHSVHEFLLHRVWCEPRFQQQLDALAIHPLCRILSFPQMSFSLSDALEAAGGVDSASVEADTAWDEVLWQWNQESIHVFEVPRCACQGCGGVFPMDSMLHHVTVACPRHWKSSPSCPLEVPYRISTPTERATEAHKAAASPPPCAVPSPKPHSSGQGWPSKPRSSRSSKRSVQ